MILLNYPEQGWERSQERSQERSLSDITPVPPKKQYRAEFIPPEPTSSEQCRDGARRVFTDRARHCLHQAPSAVWCSASSMVSCILLRTA